MADWFVWTQDLSIHVDKIDEQHQELFKKFSILADATFEGKGRETIGEALKFLADYTIQHFSDEESYMKTYAYPEYEEHKQTHTAFVADVKQFISSYESGNVSTELVIDVVKKLGDWTRDHIKGMDQKLGAFLQNKV